MIFPYYPIPPGYMLEDFYRPRRYYECYTGRSKRFKKNRRKELRKRNK